MINRRLLPGLRVKEGFLEHPFDAEFQVQTSGLVAGRHLKAGHRHDRHSTAYYGVAPSIFRAICARWVRSRPHFPVEEYSFIDFGAGMGRAMLLATEVPFREILGVELNPKLVRIAERNIASWTSRRSVAPMQMLLQEATEFSFPANPCVVFLFNPFGAPVLRRLLDRIADAFEHRPGELDLLYVNHEAEAVLKARPGLVCVGRGNIHKSRQDEEADRRIIQNQPDGEYGASSYESCSIYRWVGKPVPKGLSRPHSRISRSGSYNQARMSKKLRIGILFGGRSGEHEISLLSAASVLEAIDRVRYEVVPIGITKDGVWVTGAEATALLEGTGSSAGRSLKKARSASAKGRAVIQPSLLGKTLGVDVLFPVLHGTFGEDGTMQGLLELANIAYVGSGVLGSAAGMDKDIMKRLFASAGLPTPKHLSFSRKEWESGAKKLVKRIESHLKYPVFVKPANLGSSVGISKVHDRKELPPALELAAKYDRKIVVEQGIGGRKGKPRELEVAVLGNDSPQASVIGEIVPDKEFYDYEAKYLSDGSKPIIPARLTRDEAKQIRQMAVAAFRACDCTGLARVDFLMDPAPKRGKPSRLFVNEVNTLPGFTKISMYPKMWEASGLSYPRLIDRLIELALESRAEKDATSYSK